MGRRNMSIPKEVYQRGGDSVRVAFRVNLAAQFAYPGQHIGRDVIGEPKLPLECKLPQSFWVLMFRRLSCLMCVTFCNLVVFAMSVATV